MTKQRIFLKSFLDFLICISGNLQDWIWFACQGPHFLEKWNGNSQLLFKALTGGSSRLGSRRQKMNCWSWVRKTQEQAEWHQWWACALKPWSQCVAVVWSGKAECIQYHSLKAMWAAMRSKQGSEPCNMPWTPEIVFSSVVSVEVLSRWPAWVTLLDNVSL